MENSDLASWKRPVLLVKGPLGIVSWIELSFLTMFTCMFANVAQQGNARGRVC
jgi:hypothetical protein